MAILLNCSKNDMKTNNWDVAEIRLATGSMKSTERMFVDKTVSKTTKFIGCRVQSFDYFGLDPINITTISKWNFFSWKRKCDHLNVATLVLFGFIKFLTKMLGFRILKILIMKWFLYWMLSVDQLTMLLGWWSGFNHHHILHLDGTSNPHPLIGLNIEHISKIK